MADDIRTLCAKAKQALAENQPQVARQCYFQALAQSPDDVVVHYGLATACFMLQDFNGAIYHFNEVLRLEPQKVGAYINLGAVYNQMNKPDEAIQVLRQALKLDMKRPEAYYNLGLAHRLKGQLELALQAYREALHLNPKFMDAHFNLGNTLQDLGRYAAAISHYKQCLDIDPHFEAAKHGIAQAEAAMQPAAAAVQKAAPVEVKPATKNIVDPNAPLDPNVDGPALRALHRTTIVAENTLKDVQKVLIEEVEPAIKELSKALLGGRGAPDLADRLERFEVAMNRTNALKKTWQQNMQILRELNQKLMTKNYGKKAVEAPAGQEAPRAK